MGKNKIMYIWSPHSLKHRNACDADIQRLFDRVLLEVDCRYECGHRNKAEQNRLFQLGVSKVQWPDSKHNTYPSLAADVIPYPVIWPNIKDGIKKYFLDLGRLYMFVGYVKGIAFELGIPVRAGADWDGDFILTDQTFHDLPHFEKIVI